MEQLIDLAQNPQHLIDFIARFSQDYPYAVVYSILLLCGLGLPIPEDITLVAGGFLVYQAQGRGSPDPGLLPMIAVGMVGVLSGDVVLFLLGRNIGSRILKIWPFRVTITPDRVERVQKYFKKHGAWTAFFARFAPGLRAPIYLVAGTARMSFPVFLLADGTAALISVPLWVLVAYWFGAKIDMLLGWIHSSKYVLGGLVLGVVVFLLLRWYWRRRRRVMEIGVAPVAAGLEVRPEERS